MADGVLVLTEAELRACVGMDETALARIEDAFTWLAEGRVEMPPIMHIEVAEHAGDVDVKGAFVRGLDCLAVKIASGFFGNAALGLPNSSAMMVALSARTGRCRAVLLDNGFLTDLRTGLAGAVAARHLAPAEVGTVGVLGAGAQARYQVHALGLVRRFDRLLARGRDPARVEAYVAEMSAALPGVAVSAARSVEALVRESEVIVTTTPSREPLVRAEWLRPGQHLTAMGSDLAGKQELEPEVLAAAGRVVCDRTSQCAAMGELQHALAAGLLTEADVVELGEITAGNAPGRESPDQITVCDLTGAGVQDTAIADLAIARARERGFGTVVGG